MPTQYMVTNEELIAVANAIRTKGGTQADLEWYSGFVSAIGDISGGGSGDSFIDPKHIDADADSVYQTILSGYQQFNAAQAFGTEKKHWWGSANNSQHWLKITYAEAVRITKIKFSNFWESGSSKWQSESVVFQGSNDGNNWTDLLSLSNLTLSETQNQYTVNNNTDYIYYRFLCSSGATYYTGLGKIQLVCGGSGGQTDYILSQDYTKWDVTINGVQYGSTGAVLDNAYDYIIIPFSGSDKSDITIYIDVSSMQLSSGEHRRFVMGTAGEGFIYRNNGKWAFYNGLWEESDISDGSYFNNCKVKIYIDSSKKWHIYKNNVLVFEPSGAQSIPSFMIGSYDAKSINNAIISGIRIYNGNYTET